MENVDHQKIANNFLNDDDAIALFADIDYLLKDGVHFQKKAKQIRQFDFIERNFPSLEVYYRDFFDVKLTEGGEKPDHYFYLDFFGSSRGNISSKHREIMKSEHVLIGLILYKMVYIDLDVDVFSLEKVKQKIRVDYEDYKPGLYRLIAKSRNLNPGNLNDQAIDTTIQSAFEEFRKLGWVELEKDEFDILPSFDRLVNVYEDHINNIDDILKELK